MKRKVALRLASLVGVICVVVIAGLVREARANVLQWSPGWDGLNEQLDYVNSQVIWTQPGPTSLQITYMLVGATPNRQYQVGVHLLDSNCASPMFGQFTTIFCGPITRQGVTRNVQAFELGVVTTDAFGNGMLQVTVENIAPGTYEVMFNVRTGVGCGFNGIFQNCAVIFQAPGPSFGAGVFITVPLAVDIDIKPGSFPNSINPRSKGVIPVTILTTHTFDATTVDPSTMLFGPTGTEAGPVLSAVEDVDGDGDTDIILHFNTQATGIVCGDTSATLTGETFDGQAIEGSDSIKTVGCK